MNGLDSNRIFPYLSMKTTNSLKLLKSFKVGIMSLHWIECVEAWSINDEVSWLYFVGTLDKWDYFNL